MRRSASTMACARCSSRSSRLASSACSSSMALSSPSSSGSGSTASATRHRAEVLARRLVDDRHPVDELLAELLTLFGGHGREGRAGRRRRKIFCSMKPAMSLAPKGPRQQRGDRREEQPADGELHDHQEMAVQSPVGQPGDRRPRGQRARPRRRRSRAACRRRCCAARRCRAGAASAPSTTRYAGRCRGRRRARGRRCRRCARQIQ